MRESPDALLDQGRPAQLFFSSCSPGLSGKTEGYDEEIYQLPRPTCDYEPPPKKPPVDTKPNPGKPKPDKQSEPSEEPGKKLPNQT